MLFYSNNKLGGRYQQHPHPHSHSHHHHWHFTNRETKVKKLRDLAKINRREVSELEFNPSCSNNCLSMFCGSWKKYKRVFKLYFYDQHWLLHLCYRVYFFSLLFVDFITYHSTDLSLIHISLSPQKTTMVLWFMKSLLVSQSFYLLEG